jgi:hypothetical protein
MRAGPPGLPAGIVFRRLRSTGRPTVAAHRGDLSHGFFRVRQGSGGPGLDDDGAPNCCPNRYDHARIGFRDGVFRYLVRERLPASAVGR